MNLIPAIDLLDHKVVRLFKGDYNIKTEYNKTPEEMLENFEMAGIKMIHVVDLEGARAGIPIHLDVLTSLIKNKNPGTIIEWGGGIRNFKDVKKVIDIGADRVILGSSLVNNPELINLVLSKFGARIIAGIDAKNAEVRIAGWEKNSKIKAVDLINSLEGKGIGEVIFTDIDTDGTLKGPAIKSYENVLNTTKINLIASGGVGELSHLRALLKLSIKYQHRITGVIVGKAIYEKKFSLQEALAVLNN